MNRRSFLGRTATAGLVGMSSLSGCSRASTDEGVGDDATVPGEGNGTPVESFAWQHDVGGWVEAIVGNRLFGREFFALENADGGVFCLDAETGDHRWTYGQAGFYHTFTPLTAADALYVGSGSDVIGDEEGDTYALEFDGEERWVADTGSVYRRPQVADGLVYVGSDDGVVRAFDATDGEVIWRNKEVNDGHLHVDVVGVANVVYALTEALVALDPDTGEEQWRYGGDENRVREYMIADETAYVADRTGIAAVSDGEENWRVPMDSSPFFKDLESGRLLARVGWDLHALDTDDGEERWVARDHQHMRVDTYGGRVYIGSDEVTALRSGDGREEWRTDLGDIEEIRSVAALEDASTAGHSLYVQYNDSSLARLNPDGETTWERQVDGLIRGLLVDEYVFVGSDGGIYALDPE